MQGKQILALLLLDCARVKDFLLIVSLKTFREINKQMQRTFPSYHLPLYYLNNPVWLHDPSKQ